jgi:hypothetical protein
MSELPPWINPERREPWKIVFQEEPWEFDYTATCPDCGKEVHFVGVGFVDHDEVIASNMSSHRSSECRAWKNRWWRATHYHGPRRWLDRWAWQRVHGKRR